MAKTLQFRRANTSVLDSVTGAEGEIFIDLDTNRIRVHDGNTQGGFALSTLVETEAAFTNAVSEATSLANDAFSNAVAYVDAQTTDTIEEGNTNLYFTESRARDSLTAAGDLSYDDANGVFSVTTYKSSDFDTDFSGKNTDELTEGNTNLYFTQERAKDSLSANGDLSYDANTGEFSVTTYKSTDFDSDLATKNTDDLTEGNTNLYYTDERVRGAISSSGDLSYDANTGEFSVTTYKSTDFDTDFSGKNTDELTEGNTSLYFTDQRAIDATQATIESFANDAFTNAVSHADGLLAANDAMVFKGTLGSAGTFAALPTTHDVGWTIKVVEAGTYAGQVAEIGDMYVSLISREGAGNQNTDWAVIQTNIDGAVTGPASSSNGHVAIFDGATGKVIKSANASLGTGTLTLETSGIAAGNTTFGANQNTNATFTVDVPGTNLTTTANTITRTVESSTGDNVILPTANSTQAGVMSSADRDKLDGIAAGAQVNVATNLGTSANTTQRTVTSSTGTDVTLPVANTTQAGVMSSADRDKLDGIAAGAQVNVATNLGITAGTTAGPIVTSSTGTDATLPSAAASASGVVTTGDQTFAGTKTFNSTILGVINGNAGTATTLQTARSIGGVSFNGSANINLPGVNTAGNQNTTGSAASLTTARTIGGVSFNGTANINLPGVNTAGNQNTSGNAATATTATTATTANALNTGNNYRMNSLGVGTDASGTTGEIRATNNITAFFSDDRLKTKLGNIENALEKVCSLSGFYYEPNQTAQDLGYEVIRDVGVSAQEVQSIMPEVVVPAPIDDKYLTVRYEKIIPLLIEAIKEQQIKVELLEQKISKGK